MNPTDIEKNCCCKYCKTEYVQSFINNSSQSHSSPDIVVIRTRIVVRRTTAFSTRCWKLYGIADSPTEQFFRSRMTKKALNLAPPVLHPPVDCFRDLREQRLLALVDDTLHKYNRLRIVELRFKLLLYLHHVLQGVQCFAC